MEMVETTKSKQYYAHTYSTYMRTHMLACRLPFRSQGVEAPARQTEMHEHEANADNIRGDAVRVLKNDSYSHIATIPLHAQLVPQPQGGASTAQS